MSRALPATPDDLERLEASIRRKVLAEVNMFSDRQIAQLLQPLGAERVFTRDGNLNLQAYDVRRWLTRIFGFGGWSGEVVETTLLFERFLRDEGSQRNLLATYADATKVTVAYRVRYRLTIHGNGRSVVFTEEAVGQNANFPMSKYGGAHDMAVKTAESQALKRAAMNLGDQFGLSLYDKQQPAIAQVQGVLAGWADESRYPDVLTQTTVDTTMEEAEAEAVPESEVDWVAQAEALAGDKAGLASLWNEARAKKVSRRTLDAIRAIAEGA